MNFIGKTIKNFDFDCGFILILFEDGSTAKFEPSYDDDDHGIRDLSDDVLSDRDKLTLGIITDEEWDAKVSKEHAVEAYKQLQTQIFKGWRMHVNYPELFEPPKVLPDDVKQHIIDKPHVTRFQMRDVVFTVEMCGNA